MTRHHARPIGSPGRAYGLLALGVLAAGMALLPGCYSRRFKALEHDVDSLFARADSLAREHAATRAELAEVREELGQTMRSLRAGSETSAQELVVRIDQLEARLEEQTQLVNTLANRLQTRGLAAPDTGRVTPSPGGTGPPSGRTPGGSGSDGSPSGTPSGSSGSPSGAAGVRVDPTAAYDQAVLDFTQGRFALALQEFRDFVTKYRTSDLADNAQYGVGESLYAQGSYDSAAIEYRRVPDEYPNGEKVPAALYKLAIAYQKMNRSAEARRTFEELRDRYPRSGEARLAEERLREMGAR